MKVIDIKDLKKSFGKNQVLNDVNFSVDQGDIFGFIGPNGAGKTTTIRILLNLVFPSGGSASVFGMDVVKDTKKIKKRLGYLSSEDINHKGLKSIDLLKFTAKIYGMKTNDFNERLKKLADFLELDLKKKIKHLSKGNRKKVYLIRSIIHRPELVILDEPSSNLDPLIKSKMFDLLKEENKEHGTTIFFSSHILSDVQSMCNRISIIKGGKIIKTDTIENLQSRNYKSITLMLNQNTKTDIQAIKNIPVAKIPSAKTENFNYTDDKVYFDYQGNIWELMKYLRENNLEKVINDITIEKSTLDKMFLSYYSERGE